MALPNVEGNMATCPYFTSHGSTFVQGGFILMKTLPDFYSSHALSGCIYLYLSLMIQYQ